MAMHQQQDDHSRQVHRAAVQGLVESYADPGIRTNHLYPYVLPSRPQTLEALSRIKDLLFPDHRLNRQIRDANTDLIVGGIVEQLSEQLERQIYLALLHSAGKEPPCEELAARARDITLKFIARLPELRAQVDRDVVAALQGDPAARSYDEIVFCYPGFEAVATYRIANILHRLEVPLLPRIMTEFAHYHTGTDIHPGATIGEAFFIDHATGVVIGETAVIGARVKLYQGVTLGAMSFPRDEAGNLIRGRKRHPTIEDDVVIYAGATVLGDITIGQGAVIGGSCWVTHDIPPRTKVVLQDPQMRVSSPRADARQEVG